MSDEPELLEDPPVADAVAICHTPGCPNEDIPIPVSSTYIDDEGNEQPASFMCGVCFQPIWDVQPIS